MDSRDQHHQQQQAQQQHANMLVPGAAFHPAMMNPNLQGQVGGGFPYSLQQPKANDVMNNAAAGGFDGSSPPSSGMRFSIEPAKKKRGRPRKYTPDGNISLALSPGASSGPHHDGTPPSSSDPPLKRNRGRPPGSSKKQLDALGGVGGVGFTPHVITVKAGEDISSKIQAFSQQGPRTVCVLSANGPIANVTLRQPTNAGGTVTYEGCYEIISLSGSFLLSDNNGNHTRPIGLSVSLADPQGRVIGGGVAGQLRAAGPVQVIVGSFIVDGKKSNSSAQKSMPSSAPSPQMLNFGTQLTTSSPPSQGASDSSGENASSPINRGPGIYGSASQPIHPMPMYQHHTLWAAQNPQ